MIHRYLAQEKLGTLPSSPPKMMKSECLKKNNIQSHPIMSGIGSGNLQLSPSKLCVEHNVSESEMNMENKRRKVSVSTPVALKSENPEAHLEPVVLKRKRHYENQILPEQKQALKDKGTESEKDCLLNKIRKKCRKRRAKLFQKQQEKHGEFLQFWEKKKLDLIRDYKLELSIIRCIHGEGTTRTDNKLKLLDSGFEKKMKEHKLLKAEEHKKLLAEQWAARDEERKKEDKWLAACRSGERTTDHEPGSVGLHSEEAGLDVPNGNSSNSLGTDPQNDLRVPFSQTSDLAGVEQLKQVKIVCPQQIIYALPAFRECVPGEIVAVELNKEVPPKVPETIPKEIVDCANPVELSNSTSDEGIENGDDIAFPDAIVNLGDETDEAVVKPSEQTKASWTPHNGTLLLPQASEDKIPCSSISEVKQGVGVLVVEAQNTSPYEVTILQSNIELQNQDVPAVENQITSEIATTGINESVTPEESIVELQGQTALVIEDQYTLHNESANLELVDTVNPVQDKSAQVVEKQNASRFEVAASGHVDTITVTESNVELHDQDAPDTSRGEVANVDFIDIACEESSENLQNLDASDSATPCVDVANSEPVENLQNLGASDQATPCVDVANSEPVEVGALAVQNWEELMPTAAFPSCNQPLSIEVEIQSHNLGRSSSQTAEIADTVVVSHESASQLGENRVLQSNPFGIGSGSQVNLDMISSQTAEITDTVLLSQETSQPGVNRELQSNHFGVGIESQVPHETSVGLSSSFWNNADMSQTHQVGLQLGSVGNLYGSGNPSFHRQVTSFSSPPLYAASLQHELVKIGTEIEQLQKSHGVMKSQLKSDRDKEIMEILAQINSKYDLKLQEAEAEFSHKRNELDKNRHKVLVNKLLAESFSSNGRNILREVQPAASSSIMQHQTLRPPHPPMAMGHQPDLGHPITNIQGIQPQQLQNPTRYTVQTTQHPPPGFSFGSTSQPLRPPFIAPTANPHFRSAAPHLQSRFMPTPTFQQFQLRPSQPPQLVQGQRLNSTWDNLMSNNPSFGSLVQSHLARLQNEQRNRTPSAAVNSICLSDDD